MTAPARSEVSPARRAVGIALAVASGLAVAAQSRINGQLAADVGDSIAAAVISFGSGLVLLLALVAGWAPMRAGVRAVRDALRAHTLSPWHLAGGISGAYFVVTQGLTVPALGVAVFTVALVAGQTISGLLVDRSGLSPGGGEPITLGRLGGAALIIAAVLLAVGDRLGSPRALGLAALPALSGLGVAWQQAVNGRVRDAAGSAMPASLVNFVAGMCALLVAFAVDLAVRGAPPGTLPANPLLYVGGPLGVIFVAVAAAVVRFTGVLVLGLGLVAGQVLGAVALDAIVPGPAGPPRWHTIAGAGLALVAVGIAAGRRPTG